MLTAVALSVLTLVPNTSSCRFLSLSGVCTGSELDLNKECPLLNCVGEAAVVTAVAVAVAAVKDALSTLDETPCELLLSISIVKPRDRPGRAPTSSRLTLLAISAEVSLRSILESRFLTSRCRVMPNSTVSVVPLPKPAEYA